MSDNEWVEVEDNGWDEVMIEEESESIEENVSVKEEEKSVIQPLSVDSIEDDNRNVTFTFYNEEHTLGNVTFYLIIC